MKELLIVYNTVPPRDSHLALIQAEMGKGYQLHKGVLVDFEFWVENGHLDVLLNGRKLNSFDGVFFAKWQRLSIASAAAAYLTKHQVSYKPSEVGDFPPIDKLGETAVLADGGFPIPNSLVTSVKNLSLYFESYVKKFCFPLVLKSVVSSFGNDNFLINSVAEAQDKLSNYDPRDFFIIQDYIPNDSDFRCLVFDGHAKVLIERIRPHNAYLNNTRQGAHGEVIDNIPPQIKTLAEKAAAITKRSDFAGVDIIINKETGKPYVIEVNKSPVVLQKKPLRPEKNQALAAMLKRMA